MNHRRGFYFALVAAFLFGLGTPLVKLRFGQVDPLLLAALISFGSGIGVALITRIPWNPARLFAPGNRSLFAVSVISGGVASPFLLVWGTAHSTGSTASLLLNLEAVFTALVAWAVFKERLTWSVVFGLALVTTGGMVVSSGGHGGSEKSVLAALSVAGCCLAWAVDNNSMVRMRDVPPPLLTLWKGLLAGIILLVGSFINGFPIPAGHSIVEAILVGTGCYGLALLCFIHALNNAGAGRAAAYFAAAPFIGAGFSVVLLNEPLTARLFIAASLMAVGLSILFFEKRKPEAA